MNLNKIYNFDQKGGVSDIYTLSGSCGFYDGYDCKTEECETGFISAHGEFVINADIKNDDGVFMRSDSVKNISDKDISIYHYAYRFCLEGGEIDVYTQLSHWQNESRGEWQKLVTEISASSKGVRSTDNATPMVAVWNRQTNQGVVFHLVPQFAWKISVSKRNAVSNKVYTVIEISMYDDALNLPVKAGDVLDLSSVIYYEFSDKTTLDCYKLHKFLHKAYPRKDMPVMYNTWLAFFDRVDFEQIYEQIEEAADIGCEYFTLDAGWFGDGGASWDQQIGNWVENKTGGFKGRMIEVADKIRSSGMKFGLWLEVERALENVAIVCEHPEYFFKNNHSYFLDFANDEAREYITQVTLGLIGQYNIEYIKFDFNDSITFDRGRKAFYDYHKGYAKYLSSLREKYPDIYFECCASGGARMDIENLRLFDSFWFSDNQSPYDGLEIIKNTILRMVPSAIDRWAVLVSRDGFIPAYGTEDKTVRTMATDNGTWDAVVGVTPEFMCGFFAGGAAALSCDLTKLDIRAKKQLKDFIAEYKKDRGFWKDAACRILCDTESLLVMQYENGGEIKIVIYTKKLTQQALTVYPAIENRDYTIDGVKRSYEDIKSNGIRIENPENNFAYIISLK